MNSRKKWSKIFHLTSNLFLHYLVKCECATSACYLMWMWYKIVYFQLISTRDVKILFHMSTQINLKYYSMCYNCLLFAHASFECTPHASGWVTLHRWCVVVLQCQLSQNNAVMLNDVSRPQKIISKLKISLSNWNT